MKPSELMLKGFAMAGGNQCEWELCQGDGRKPDAVCAIGALALGESGSAFALFGKNVKKALSVFYKATGMGIASANNVGMAIEDIAGILASEGY